MIKKKVLRNQKGFTLIEIIAVLIILGILAAVAIPRFFNLQDQAMQKARDAAFAESYSRVNMHFAQALLSGSAADQINYDDATLGTDLGDWTLGVAGGAAGTAGPIQLTITGNAGTSVAAATAEMRPMDRPTAP